jgi:hypothetical protein
MAAAQVITQATITTQHVIGIIVSNGIIVHHHSIVSPRFLVRIFDDFFAGIAGVTSCH